MFYWLFKLDETVLLALAISVDKTILYRLFKLDETVILLGISVD